ncbi:hypothetical protein GCM10007972_27130 [Iodidimonas muriae]|uniref:Uncharacterized protein n=1 Tax=Iodidimonas muriae TaxID=261467 RepID=A0ABQ2LGG4_9PROT|nr:hypothetical protein [Iodidimonas muriae]GER08695.1 hypothetical protein JCM17843_30050 [Kordiimonadales bacterium JCM 17843]GGO17205.1 hypothetical protein GCM10007972_27130 [Iodidimonas muriae]
MTNSLQNLAEKFSNLSELRASSIERLQKVKGTNETQFDLSKTAPSIDRTLADVDARVIAICEIAPKSGDEENSDSLLIPNAYVNRIIKPLDQLTVQYQSIADNLSNIDSNGGPGTLNPEDLTFQSANGQINLQLGPIFQNIWNHSEAVLAALYPLMNLLRGEGRPDFAAALDAFSTAMEQVHAQRSTLQDVAKSAQADRKKIGDFQAQSGPLKDEIERLKTESEKDRKTLKEYATEGTQAITSIRTTNEQAEQLKTAVDNYQASFDSFQKQLEAREKIIQTGKKEQDELIANLKEIESDTKRLTKQAEAMLTGATVAGLAGSFGELRDKTSSELIGARWIFYFAIFLLFLSVIPLVAYVVPGVASLLGFDPAAASNLPKESGVLEFFGQVVVRALLLLPAAWFAKFAATRHAVLFRLKEHYAYKYSVAASVEGFKQQAEPFKDEIAAATFFELTFNPADRMEAKAHEERHPNPAMEWVMKKFGATYDGK